MADIVFALCAGIMASCGGIAIWVLTRGRNAGLPFPEHGKPAHIGNPNPKVIPGPQH